jgi:hypothetical protein
MRKNVKSVPKFDKIGLAILEPKPTILSEK